MAKKKKSFVERVKMSTEPSGEVCDECGQEIEQVKLIDPQYIEGKDAWVFNSKVINICNCNRNEVYQ